jgi:hypothetical protein
LSLPPFMFWSCPVFLTEHFIRILTPPDSLGILKLPPV